MQTRGALDTDSRMDGPTGAVAQNWRLLRIFNLYRLLLASSATAIASFGFPLSPFGESSPLAFLIVSVLYSIVTLASVIAARQRVPGFEVQTSLYAFADIVLITLLMHASGGMASGLGLLYVRRELQDRIWPNIVTENWWSYSDARKYDRLSRRPWPVVAALEDALDFQLAIGKQRIEQRVRNLADYFRREAAKIPHVRLYTSQDPRLSGGMTSLQLDNVPSGRVREYLRQRFDVYVAARTKGERYPADPHGVDGIRLSTHFYNTFEQLDKVLEGLKELADGRS